jgi:hypothetical protein
MAPPTSGPETRPMLFEIGGHRTEKANPDGLDLLLACHTRIRHFSALAARVSCATDAHTTQVAEAAAGVHRYFTVAMPLHVEDEDRYLIPLLAPVADPSLLDALHTIERQHREIDALLAELLPRFQALTADPTTLSRLFPAGAGDVDGFAALIEEHLGIEETTVFPAARGLLDAAALDGLAKEIRARRSDATMQEMSALLSNTRRIS